MSDFDREAERERLREKYERDKKKREASERMSELLLQGATMTNRHCPECHSPVFRYDGREFCPTCEKEVTEEGELIDPGADESETRTADGAEADAGAAPGRDAVDGEDADASATSEPESTETDAKADIDTSVDDGADDDAVDESRSTVDSRPAPSRDRRPARVRPPARRETDHEDSRGGGDDLGRRSSDVGARDDGDLRDAEATLVREIAALTRRAEETRDVGRKRDLLAAAREAAETLQAVRRL